MIKIVSKKRKAYLLGIIIKTGISWELSPFINVYWKYPTQKQLHIHIIQVF